MPHSLSRLAAAALVGFVIAVASPARAVGNDLQVPGQYSTISLALAAAFSADTIVISAGTYDECVVVSGLVQLTIIGKRGAIIDASACGTGLTIASGADITVKGLTITGATTQGILVLATASEVLFQKTVIQDLAVDPADSVLETGVSIIGANDVTLDNVDIRGARVQAVSVLSAIGTVVKKTTIIDGLGDGIRVDLGKGVKIEKNVFGNLLGPAIRFFHDDLGLLDGGVESLVVANKIIGSSGGGIVIGGANNLIEKNTVVNPGALGIVALPNGGGSIYRRNKVTGATGAGIVAGGEEDTFEKNSVKQALGDGVEVTGSDNVFLGMKVKEAVGSGFVVAAGATGNAFDFCKSSKAGVDGFHVDGTLNTFTQSSAAGSGGLDLNDAAGVATTNVYTDCKFKTSNVP